MGEIQGQYDCTATLWGTDGNYLQCRRLFSGLPCAEDCAALQKFMFVSQNENIAVVISYDQRHRHDIMIKKFFVNKMAILTWQLNVRYLILPKVSQLLFAQKQCFSKILAQLRNTAHTTT